MRDRYWEPGKKLFVLEYEEFTRIREAIAAYIGEIQTAADLISDLDVIYSLGELLI
jgi:DNA mismatch repair ATPase MutS